NHPAPPAPARAGPGLSRGRARGAAPGREGAAADEGGGQDVNAWAPAGTDGPPLAQALLQGAAAAADHGGPAVRWVEHGLHHVRLHSAPLSVAQAFSRFRPAGQAWVLASATLSVHGDFQHFTSQLGLHDAETLRWESPFAYPEQGLLFVPRDLPLPQSPQFTERFVQRLLPLLEASPGGALILCTTLRGVERVADLLQDAFEERGWTWPLMRQGEAPRRDLLERF